MIIMAGKPYNISAALAPAPVFLSTSGSCPGSDSELFFKWLQLWLQWGKSLLKFVIFFFSQGWLRIIIKLIRMHITDYIVQVCCFIRILDQPFEKNRSSGSYLKFTKYLKKKLIQFFTIKTIMLRKNYLYFV